jgi:hypothetical protein
MEITVERLKFTEPSEAVPQEYNCRYHININVFIFFKLHQVANGRLQPSIDKNRLAQACCTTRRQFTTSNGLSGAQVVHI